MMRIVLVVFVVAVGLAGGAHADLDPAAGSGSTGSVPLDKVGLIK